jgi:AcrR family transcriptional regulator
MNDNEISIINAALALAEEKGWSDVTLHGIAERAGITLAALYAHVPGKHAVLCLLSRQINDIVLRGAFQGNENETPRERLFEVLMARFDALKPFRPGLKAILKDAPRDPAAAALMAAMLPPAMAWMLEAAGIDAGGLAGPVKVLALSGLYAKALRVWLEDGTEDSAKTMAELDRLLKRAEGWAKSFERR